MSTPTRGSIQLDPPVDRRSAASLRIQLAPLDVARRARARCCWRTRLGRWCPGCPGRSPAKREAMIETSVVVHELDDLGAVISKGTVVDVDVAAAVDEEAAVAVLVRQQALDAPVPGPQAHSETAAVRSVGLGSRGSRRG